MIIRKKLAGAIGIVAMASAAVLVLSGCTRDGGGSANGDTGGVTSSPGITDTTLTFGITTPLSGPLAGPGNCAADGAVAYFESRNAAGGITFGDGKTRTIELSLFDDQLDPQKALGNFQQMVADGVFAAGIGLGTATNRAWREAAIDEEVPQVLIISGDPIFSDRQESPWQLGLPPTYPQEGAAFGKALIDSGEPHKVAILQMNDDYGAGYVEGFKAAVEGSPDIEIVGEALFAASDTSVDPQITELAGTGADVILNANGVTPLAIGAMQKAQQLGWFPSWMLPSNTASPSGVIEPGGGDAYPGIYTVAFAQDVNSPAVKDSDEGKALLSALAEYTNQEAAPSFPHCVWSWIAAATLEHAFTIMEEPTRESFMEAMLSISDFRAPLMMPGTAINSTIDGIPAVAEVVLQKFNGEGYVTVDAIG